MKPAVVTIILPKQAVRFCVMIETHPNKNMQLETAKMRFADFGNTTYEEVLRFIPNIV
jgi:hypothetical protein